MTIVTIVASTFSANAAVGSSCDIVGNRYYYFTVSTTGQDTKVSRLSMPGIRKRNYVTTSVTITVSESFSNSTKIDIETELKAGFFSAGSSIGISESTTNTTSTSTVLNLEANAPSGIYYPCMIMPYDSGTYYVNSCSFNHVNWSVAACGTFEAAPNPNYSYVDLLTYEEYCACR